MVSYYAVAIAQALQLPLKLVEGIQIAGILHDIGKIGIPDAILLKPGKLSAGEFDIIKTHCQIGARILLVEDNQTNQEVTYQLLEAFGVTMRSLKTVSWLWRWSRKTRTI